MKPESIKIKLLLIGLMLTLLSACVTGCQKTNPEPQQLVNNSQNTPCNPYHACFEGVFMSDTNSLLLGQDTVIPNGKIQYVFDHYSHINEFGNYTIDSLWYRMEPVNMDTSVLSINSQRMLHFKYNDGSYTAVGLICKSGKYITFYKQ